MTRHGTTRCDARTDLEDVPPILPLVIQPFIQHLHDLDEFVLGVGHLCDLVHLRSRGSPGVVGRRPADLDLGVGVAFGIVFSYPDGTSAATMECGSSSSSSSVVGQGIGRKGDEGKISNRIMSPGGHAGSMTCR